MADLSEIRKQIDEVDKKIVQLFENRMSLCEDVAEYKIKTGKQVLDTGREKEKLDNIKPLVQKEENRHDVRELFKQIMAMSRKLQYKLMAKHGLISDVSFRSVDTIIRPDVKVVYQGVEGAYAHEASLQYFGDEADCYHVESWRDAMEEVKSGRADYAVLPIENSTAGAVTQVHDLLLEYDNYIVAETEVLVEHALLGLADAKISDITTVYSHPQALMQCEKYLREHREWQQISCENTAVSAKKVCDEGDKTHVAIASVKAAKIHGLKVLKERINQEDANTTRFLIVGRERIYTKEADKISICVEMAHESGTLYNVLSHFSYNGINMTKIESRPIENRQWEYRFIIDIEGKISDGAVNNALRGISEEVSKLVILGNY